MTRSILIFVITLLIGGLQSVSAQVSFAKDKLYNIFPASQPEKVIAYQKGDAKPILVAPRAKDKFQQWSITDLSSSFRFMNPFDNQALHARTPQPHEMDRWMICTKLKLPLDSTDNKQFTFGLTSKKLSKRVDAITSAINNVKNALFGLVGHVNEDDSSS